VTESVAVQGTFDLDEYVQLLLAAREGGYRFAGFDRDPQPGEVILRHDVDLSLEAALAMAEVERAYGATATYFLMTESVFYNLASPVGVEAIQRLRDLGHAVGLHAVWPRAELDERFDPVVAWHNPDPEYMRQPVAGAANVMEERFSRHYRSDSNQHWRQGSPRTQLAAGGYEWLQLLTHPEIWVFEGETMGETMRSLLVAEQETRLGYMRHDRLDLD
jgi:hypothetical protein